MSTYSLQEEAVFAAGGFWEVEDAFARLHGVVTTDVGYAGGSSGQPTYHDIGDHIEAVRIVFDQRAISYEELLKVFWKHIDISKEPERRHSHVIFTLTDHQKRSARNNAKELQVHRTIGPGAVTIEPLARFWPAEEYHQHYLAKLRGDR